MAQAFEVVSPTKTPLTLIEFILDETGSMAKCRQSTISGFNEYISSQRSANTGDCYLTLTKFDQRGYGERSYTNINALDVRTLYTDVPVEHIQNLNEETYSPNGMTNLYDAVGLRINALAAREAQHPGAAKLIVIMTDGEDNCSREFNASSLKALIGAKEKEGWTFVFLGANQDAWTVGQTFGMAKGNTMTYDTSNISATMGTLASATTAYRSVRAQGSMGSTETSRDFFTGIKPFGEK